MKLRKKRKSEMIPMSAMGDIAFLLLVFYMATTMVTDQKPLEMDLPEITASAETSPYPLIIYVDSKLASKNQAFFFSQTYPLKGLGQEVQAKASAAPAAVRVYLNIEKDVPYLIMNRVIDELKEAGIQNLIITTRPDEANR